MVSDKDRGVTSTPNLEGIAVAVPSRGWIRIGIGRDISGFAA